MNELNKIEEAAENYARAIHAALMKSGAKAFLGVPTEAEMNELRMERERVRQTATKTRVMRKNLEFERLKQDALQSYARSRGAWLNSGVSHD